MYDYDCICIGGGLAGLTAALHLSKEGYQVLVIEKNEYPNHKVCGEYVSNEVAPYLQELGVDLPSAAPIAIDTLLLSTKGGKSLKTKLPLGGFGLSRYAFDELLYQTALKNGANVNFDTVVAVDFNHDTFTVSAKSGKKYTAKQVLGAYGKRSNLDPSVQSDKAEKSPWLAVKAHYDFQGFPDNLVALHNFRGGYGGLSKTEQGSVNFCYLASYQSFKQVKDIEAFNTSVVAKNPFLGEFLQNAVPLFDKPLTIAQVSFERKPRLQQGMLCIGDAAGMIHPLCGNGMAMAIHSAKLAVEALIPYLEGTHSRTEVGNTYDKAWQRQFSRRLWLGRQIQRLLLHETLAESGMRILAQSENLVQRLISGTHGKPLTI